MAIDRSASTTLPIQEVGIVLCLDSSIPTLQFWHDASPAYIQPLIQSIWKKNVSNQYENTLRVGSVLYTRSDVYPPITTNVYFTSFDNCMREWKDPISFGLGATSGGGEAGMALLEGLVASTEMCDILIAEATKKRLRPQHPNIPPPPKRVRPICHIIVIGSAAPGGPSTPMHNNDPTFDDITLETLPAELVARNIKISFVLPTAIQGMIDFFKKMGEPAETPPFRTMPIHTILVSGSQASGEHINMAKRAVAAENEASPKRQKLVNSPKPPARTAATLGQLPVPAFDSANAPSEIPKPLAGSQPHPNPTVPGGQTHAQLLDYQRQLRQKAQAEIIAMRGAAIPPASDVGGLDSTPTNTSVSIPPQEVKPTMVRSSSVTGKVAQLIPHTSPMAPSTSGRDGPVERPQSQPQNPSAQMQKMASSTHGRSHSTFVPNQQPVLLPAQTISTAGPPASESSSVHSQVSPQQSVRSTPQQHARLESVASNNGRGPSPFPPSSSAQSSPKRPESNTGSVPPTAPPLGNLGGVPVQQSTSAMIAQLKLMSQTGIGGRLLESQLTPTGAGSRLTESQLTNGPGRENAEALAQQQQLFAAKIAHQGLLQHNPPPVAPNPDAARQAQHANTDMWQGVLAVQASEQKIGSDLTISVTAKLASKNNPNVQFVMWPPRLAFGSAQYRQYELTEFGNLIKSNAIPLCMFEPNQSAFPFNSEQAKRNDQSFSLLHKFLTERKAGVAIHFPLPSGPAGTGLFLFTPVTKENNRSIIGAAFLTIPIPHLPLLPPLANNNPNPNPLGNVPNGVTGLMGGHPNMGSVSGMNQAMVEAQAMRMKQMMQAKLQQNARIQQQQQQQQQNAQQQQQQSGGPSFAGMGLGGMPGMGPGSFLGGAGTNAPTIPPQAQAQNRLLSGGFNSMGVGGFDANGGGGGGGGGMGMGLPGGFGSQAAQLGNMQGLGARGAMNLVGAGMNMGGAGGGGGGPLGSSAMNTGMGGLGALGGFNADMLRAFMPQSQGGNGGSMGGGPGL